MKNRARERVSRQRTQQMQRPQEARTWCLRNRGETGVKGQRAQRDTTGGQVGEQIGPATGALLNQKCTSNHWRVLCRKE